MSRYELNGYEIEIDLKDGTVAVSTPERKRRLTRSNMGGGVIYLGEIIGGENSRVWKNLFTFKSKEELLNLADLIEIFLMAMKFGGKLEHVPNIKKIVVEESQ